MILKDKIVKKINQLIDENPYKGLTKVPLDITDPNLAGDLSVPARYITYDNHPLYLLFIDLESLIMGNYPINCLSDYTREEQRNNFFVKKDFDLMDAERIMISISNKIRVKENTKQLAQNKIFTNMMKKYKVDSINPSNTEEILKYIKIEQKNNQEIDKFFTELNEKSVFDIKDIDEKTERGSEFNLSSFEFTINEEKIEIIYTPENRKLINGMVEIANYLNIIKNLPISEQEEKREIESKVIKILNTIKENYLGNKDNFVQKIINTIK